MAAEGDSQSREAAREPFMALVRELVSTYQAFEHYAGFHIRRVGMTPPEFDVVSTLGNTGGMTFKELGRRTLIYKTTLTGVVDRLESKGLVTRRPAPSDRRSMIVALTASGDAVFQRVFPEHIAYLKERFGVLDCQEIETCRKAFRRVRDLL